MPLKSAALAAALIAGGATLVAPTTAAADPVVPCWSRSTYISGNPGYFNLTYKNCGGSTVSVMPYDEFYGCLQPRKTVAPGTWVSWTHLPAPAWHSDYVAAC